VRAELDQLTEIELAGERDRSQALFHLLDYCQGLEVESPQQWKSQPAQRLSPDLMVEAIVPELAYFLPTPAELDEAKRRLRLHVLHDGRLSANVLGVLGEHADRGVFHPVVDVLESYDGDPSRYNEIVAALQAVPSATFDAPKADAAREARARRAIEHVRHVGASVVEHGHSLGFWANSALNALGGVEHADRTVAKGAARWTRNDLALQRDLPDLHVVIRAAAERVERDIATTTGLTAEYFVTGPDEEGRYFAGNGPMAFYFPGEDLEEFTVDFADCLSEWVCETLADRVGRVREARTWPRCPVHEHSLDPALVGGAAVWECREDPAVRLRIGELGKAPEHSGP
jgi:hypothetical protein